MEESSEKLVNIPRLTEWIMDRLLSESGEKIFYKNELRRRISEVEFQKLGPKWSNATSAIAQTLKSLEYEVEKGSGYIKLLSGPRPKPQVDFSTDGFRAHDNEKAKEKIGQFVGERLTQSDKEVFLGPGSTVFHVGRYITRGNDDRYVTINPAVAAEWAMRIEDPEHPSPTQLTILGGVLDTERFRYSGLLNHEERDYAVVLAGVDGASINGGKCTLTLKNSAFANTTNEFLKLAKRSIVICVASDKMKLENMQTGPPLRFPEDGQIRKYVVTDTEPDLSVRRSLWQQEVLVVVPPFQDFPKQDISYSEWVTHGKQQLKLAEDLAKEGDQKD